MTHLFLAYSRDDRRIMEPLRDALRGYGLTVWTDEHLAPGTPDWEITIERQIKEAGAVIVLLSPQASAPGSYVRNEIRLALLHGRPIFPVLAAGDATTAIPASLITHQYIDLRGRTQRNADEAVYQLAHAAADALGVAVQQPAATVLTVNIGGDVYGDVNMAGRDLTHQQAPTAQVETQGWPLLDRLARVWRGLATRQAIMLAVLWLVILAVGLMLDSQLYALLPITDDDLRGVLASTAAGGLVALLIMGVGALLLRSALKRPLPFSLLWGAAIGALWFAGETLTIGWGTNDGAMIIALGAGVGGLAAPVVGVAAFGIEGPFATPRRRLMVFAFWLAHALWAAFWLASNYVPPFSTLTDLLGGQALLVSGIGAVLMVSIGTLSLAPLLIISPSR